MFFPSLIGFSGSIRTAASSTMLLKWLADAIDSKAALSLYAALPLIPPFDGAEPLPGEVDRLIGQIRRSQGVIFCSPEYAHGVPGVLKNALDWTVASDVWIDKPACVITAAGQGLHAHTSLIETLRTMSASVQDQNCLLIPFVRAKVDAAGNVTDEATRQELLSVVNRFVVSVGDNQ